MADLRQKCSNTFLGGMNKDVSDAYLKNSQYRHAENFRVLSDKNDQLGSLNNIKGNIKTIDKSLLRISNVYSIKYDFPNNQVMPTFLATFNVNGTLLTITANESQFKTETDLYKFIKTELLTNFPFLSISYNRYWMLIYTKDLNQLNFTFSVDSIFTYQLVAPHSDGLVVIGSTYVRDDIILFTCTRSTSLYYQLSQIWKLNYNDSTDPPIPTLDLLYNNRLNFSIDYPIFDAKGNIENDECKKVYFTDNNNYFRSFNYADENAFALLPESLDILGDVNFAGKPLLENVVSGNLPCGRIQYAYSLYNKYMSETNISPLSNMIHLAINSEFDSTDYNYHGDIGTKSSGKGIVIRIKDIDKRYKYIKIFSVLYKDGISDPEISQIIDEEIVSNNMIFIDDGKSFIKSISSDEFSIYNKIVFKCKTFDTKNNLLITGNTSGELFDVDFDARAYRFNLYDPFNPLTNYAEVKENDTTPTYAIDINFDANLYTPSTPPALTLNTINANTSVYKYKKGSNRIGGSGPNVSYEVKAFPLKLGNGSGTINADPRNFREEPRNEYWGDSGNPYYMGEDFVNNKNSFCGYASPFNAGQFCGYRRNETYRFGIIFYNKKGLRSSVKWIGDIKMPDVIDKVGYHLYIDDLGNSHKDFRTFFQDAAADIYAVPLYVQFDVTIPDDIKDEVVGYEIVRVHRSEMDKTVRAQGYIGTVFTNPPTGEYFVRQSVVDYWGDGFNFANDVVSFASPEGVFNQNLSHKSDDKLQLLMLASNYAIHFGEMNTNIINGHAMAMQSLLLKNITDNKFIPSSITEKCLLINNNIGPSPRIITVYNRTHANTSVHYSPCGSRNLLTLASGNNSMPPTQYWGHYIANIINNNVIQYGGNTYGDRVLNQYISTGSYVNVNSTINNYSSNVFGGDTYITMFDYHEIIYSLANSDSGLTPIEMCNILFPVESDFNLALRTGKSFLKSQNVALQEKTTNFVGTSLTYIQDYDLYSYNPAYSRPNNINLYFSENQIIFKPKKFDCRIRSSLRKVNGEFNDSWTNFTSGNYLDINSSYGEITKIVNFKNNIYTLQNNAIGISSIDDRSIVKDVSANDIVLGIGGILQRHDYLNNTSGTSHQSSVILSDTALYYFDSTDRQIKVLTEQEGSISDSFGLKSYLYNNINGDILTNDNPHLGLGINGYYDDRYNEIVFTFHKSNSQTSTIEDITVAFNEALKVFTGFYTFSSPIYIKHYSKIISINRDWIATDMLYLHNFGRYNQFFDINYDSKIHLLLNDKYPIIKVFDSLQVDCEILDTNNPSHVETNVLIDFFDLIRCYNEYQNTDWHELFFNNISVSGKQINYDRRERLYTLQIPRNIVDAFPSTNPDIFDPIFLTNFNREFRERLRGKSLNLEFIFKNPINRKFSSQFINTNYRISAR
jgi:hypothetical protein